MKTTMAIHPTAIVDSKAQLGNNVQIGAYAFIGPNVTLGDNCIVEHHATIDGYTTLGTDNVIYPYSFLGAKTHDLKHKGGICFLKIGNGNTFREYTSIHTATNDGDATVIGDRNYILAFSHVGHDCCLGNDIIISAQVAMGGHVQVGDHANIGGNSSIHQFCRIGTFAMLSAHSFLKKDIPPFMIAFGVPAIAKSYNRIGILRQGFSDEERIYIKQLFKQLYESNLNRTQAIENIQKSLEKGSFETIRQTFLDFVQQPSSRGLL